MGKIGQGAVQCGQDRGWLRKGGREKDEGPNSCHSLDRIRVRNSKKFADALVCHHNKSHLVKAALQSLWNLRFSCFSQLIKRQHINVTVSFWHIHFFHCFHYKLEWIRAWFPVHNFNKIDTECIKHGFTRLKLILWSENLNPAIMYFIILQHS